jgi:serine/tyrosine/threonine adenylyltransferase
VSVTVRPLPALEHTYAADVPELVVPWRGAAVPDPHLVALNEPLAIELGLDPAALASPEGVAVLAGAQTPEGAVAMAYAGHQFGHFNPRLGDGRALLLGELVDPEGRRRDLHLKGSGRTPFARGGDGKAAIGPMLRELVVSEALHALGIPTTRSLAVCGTGEQVLREAGPLPGAVLTRVAASHVRVGTFQYAAATAGPDVLRRLADHAIARHHPQAADAERPALALLEAVTEAQASLVAQWVLVGFVHGVMNTDNVAISGESIDFGPCAFMEAFDPATVFSSIDQGGRYAFGNQPAIAQWDLARLAEALLPLIDADQPRAVELATEVLLRFPDRFEAHRAEGMRAKLGLAEADPELAQLLLDVMHTGRVDWTAGLRSLSAAARGDEAPARARFGDAPGFDQWLARWLQRAPDADAMDRVNPAVVPRNHLVEDALAAATAGDLEPVGALLAAIRRPYEPTERFTEPAPAGDGPYVTFCGT